MKYYHKIFKWDNGREIVDNYDSTSMPPINKPIWAVAYDINDETKHHDLICKPVLGEIIKEYDKKEVKNWARRIYSKEIFIPYKKNGKGFRKSGIVEIDSRWYADTYEEAVEMYNELVQKRIDKLQEMIKEAKGDLI